MLFSAFLLSFASCFFLTKFTIFISKRYIRKYQPIRDLGLKEHQYKKNTPIFGGIAIFLSVLIVGFMKTKDIKVLLIFLVMPFFMMLLGLADDIFKIKGKTHKGLKVINRIFVECLVSILFIFILKRLGLGTSVVLSVPFYDTFIFDFGNFYYPFAVFFCVSVINSVNLTDGLDGLAAGQSFLVIVTALILSFITSGIIVPDIWLLSVCFLGAILAFLIFNTNPASIFMGEAGSLMLGGFIASIFLVFKLEFTFLFIGFVFFFETVSVLLQILYFKITKGKRIFRMTPFHHNLEKYGIKEQKITFNAFIFTLLMCVVAIVSYVT